MRKSKNIPKKLLLVGVMMATTWSVASSIQSFANDVGGITIKEASVQGVPKGSTIQASIDGHTLTVVFTENIGQVAMEITTVSGTPIQTMWVFTPYGWQTYLYQTGNYIITFTLSNGDEYYGEFTVTD